jgi:hypothetical protein
MVRYISIVLGLLMFTAVPVTNAEQAKIFGDYAIHYSTFTTDMLTPEIARGYNISRSKNRALLNISVLKKVLETTTKPVRATVVASATNLSAQLKNLDIKEISDQGAIYYIAEIPVADRETLNFNISVTPEGETSAYTLTFQQEFFTN